MVETISRQLENVVLGQRLFSDIQVWSIFKTWSLSSDHSHFYPVCSGRWSGPRAQTPPYGSLWYDAGCYKTSWKYSCDLWKRFCSFKAMFSDSFLESSARCVRFPGVTCATFRSLLHFLYTGDLRFLALFVFTFLPSSVWLWFLWAIREVFKKSKWKFKITLPSRF